MSVFHRLMDSDNKTMSTKLPWHAASSARTKNAPSIAAANPALQTFPFQALPIEIQLLVLRQVPARTLTRSIAATSKHNKHLVDVLIQRKLAEQVQTQAWRKSNVVVFEAQRPIDTLTTRHVLHFSHFEQQAEGGQEPAAATVYAVFSFLPIEAAGAADLGAKSTTSDQPQQPPQPGFPRGEDGTLQPEGPTYGQPTFPGVLLADQHRLRQAHISSSVPTSGSSTPRARTRNSSPERRRSSMATPQQTEAGPSNLQRGRHVDAAPETRGRPSMEEDDDGAALRGHGQGYEQSARARGDVLLQSTWSEPVSSSLAALNARTRSVSVASQTSSSSTSTYKDVHEQFRLHCQAPMYRFQLDSLDSFETWILSLTVQQRRSPAPEMDPITTLIGYQQRWEKRVAEGLDRVFRDWFRPLAAPERTSGSLDDVAMRNDSTFAAHQRMRSQAERASYSFHETSRPNRESAFDVVDYVESFPQSRTLEIDGEGCTMEMQPHANRDAELHPALASMSSHYYLSSSSPYVATPSTARVEYTFHCKSVRINAARILSTFEDIDADADRAHHVAGNVPQRGRLVGMTSGGSSWTPNANDDGQMTIAPRRRGFMGGRDAAAAVVIFGAARE